MSVPNARPVGAPLVRLLRDHRDQQIADQARAGSMWQDSGRAFTSDTGELLCPSSDYYRWKSLLKAAGVREARLHDARRTAATVLLLFGVPRRTVMGIMGWSSTSIAARYQHVTDPIRQTVADQVGGLLWTESSEADDAN